MKYIVTLFLMVISTFWFCSLTDAQSRYTHWVCQDCDPFMQPNYNTISEAVKAAEPGDTIIIKAEEFPPGSAEIVTYSEYILIDKPLTIKCKRLHPVLGYPIITVKDFDSVNAVIEISETAAGTSLSNLHIRGPLADNTNCQSKPVDCADQKIGIKINAPACIIDTCKITHCMTGVFVNQIDTGKPATENLTLTNCTIGEPWIGIIKGYYFKEESWTDSCRGTPIAHPGNGFGVIIQHHDTNGKPGDHSKLINENSIHCNRYGNILNKPDL